jgi:addiction module RelB/DinJ family antitoxin
MVATDVRRKSDSEIKIEAEELFAEFGLTLTTAINMFLRQAVRKKALPLDLSLISIDEISNNQGHIHLGSGKLKFSDLAGEVQLADDYNYKAMREGSA